MVLLIELHCHMTTPNNMSSIDQDWDFKHWLIGQVGYHCLYWGFQRNVALALALTALSIQRLWWPRNCPPHWLHAFSHCFRFTCLAVFTDWVVIQVNSQMKEAIILLADTSQCSARETDTVYKETYQRFDWFEPLN